MACWRLWKIAMLCRIIHGLCYSILIPANILYERGKGEERGCVWGCVEGRRRGGVFEQCGVHTRGEVAVPSQKKGKPKYMYVHKESHPHHIPHAADDRHLELALHLRDHERPAEAVREKQARGEDDGGEAGVPACTTGGY
ncbi:hypothetical protein C8J57DRAFT_1213127 [Mycena rebaudengoi]|nr:hypothetical protein C8J57DRAFT_1213127 [Mycena rebaudengoi]